MPFPLFLIFQLCCLSWTAKLPEKIIVFSEQNKKRSYEMDENIFDIFWLNSWKCSRSNIQQLWTTEGTNKNGRATRNDDVVDRDITTATEDLRWFQDIKNDMIRTIWEQQNNHEQSNGEHQLHQPSMTSLGRIPRERINFSMTSRLEPAEHSNIGIDLVIVCYSQL